MLKSRPSTGARMGGASAALTFLAVSCSAAAPEALTPVQVVKIVPAPSHGAAPVAAHSRQRSPHPPASAQFPESCRASPPEVESAGTTAKVDLPVGSLSVRVVHAADSNDDVCLAILTDARGSVTDCKMFADEGCDMEAPVTSVGRVTVEGVCITERCGAAPQRSRRLFEVFAAAANRIEVHAVTGDVVQECGGE